MSETMFTIATLEKAAREAARRSTGGLTISICIVEQGFVISGNKAGETYATDIAWRHADINPGLIENAIDLVAGRLE